MKNPAHFYIASREPAELPYHYAECGLDNIYLLNGFKLERHGGEESVSIENLEGLWKAIGLHLVQWRKVLSPLEVRFLRSHMNFTQSELASFLRVDDQTVARWEKGKVKLPGPADVALRALFLSADIAQPEGRKILGDYLVEVVQQLVERDQPCHEDLLFSQNGHGWKHQATKAA
jgi:DNA-binding transcriptional regulator YiaG